MIQPTIEFSLPLESTVFSLSSCYFSQPSISPGPSNPSKCWGTSCTEHSPLSPQTGGFCFYLRILELFCLFWVKPFKKKKPNIIFLNKVLCILVTNKTWRLPSQWPKLSQQLWRKDLCSKQRSCQSLFPFASLLDSWTPPQFGSFSSLLFRKLLSSPPLSALDGILREQ